MKSCLKSGIMTKQIKYQRFISFKAKDLWKVTRGACHPNLQVAMCMPTMYVVSIHLGFN